MGRLYTGAARTAIGLLICTTSTLLPQYTTASLGGVVMDQNGGYVSGAVVKVENVETALTKAVVTGIDGAYLLPALAVGRYKLTVDKSGFSPYVQTGIVLTVNQAATQSVSLRVGTTSQQITVNANASLVTTETATIGELVSEKLVVDLPINGRDPASLLFLAPGTVNMTASSQSYPNSPLNEQMAVVNGGARIGSVNYQLDGAGHNDSYVGINLPFPNPDAIQEFNLQSNNMSAEYGNGANVVNIITKSGTNQFHGDLFEFVRNGDLNARNFFAPRQDTLKRNQFGGALGGPIKKNRLFFFGTYQGTRITQAAAGLIAFVPTAAQRSGDFSALTVALKDPEKTPSQAFRFRAIKCRNRS